MKSTGLSLVSTINKVGLSLTQDMERFQTPKFHYNSVNNWTKVNDRFKYSRDAKLLVTKLREEEESSSDDDGASSSSSSSDDDGVNSSSSSDDDDEPPRRDELELSFVDLTPQFETLFISI